MAVENTGWKLSDFQDKERIFARTWRKWSISPGRLKRVSMHKVELARVPETEQGEDTVPVWCKSLGRVLGAFGMKNISVHCRKTNW